MSRCEACWTEAQVRHANGQGEGESVTAVYGRLIDTNWCTSPGGQRVVSARALDAARTQGDEARRQLDEGRRVGQ